MIAILFSAFPWSALGLLVLILVSGLVFSNQDMLELVDNDSETIASEEKCSDCS
ncbi:MAG: hypothetical protein VXV96_10570 [Bdellovibrionota bacterium]|nr:hypothetical protein [Bdellovibrionota bacterium]